MQRRRPLVPADYIWNERPAYEPAPRCEDCVHFIPDPINPPAGVGSCKKGFGGFHAGAPHRCKGFTQRTA